MVTREKARVCGSEPHYNAAMQTFRVSNVRMEGDLLAAIAPDRAIAHRIAEPVGRDELFESWEDAEPDEMDRLYESWRSRNRAQLPPLEAWGCNHELVSAPGLAQPAHPLIEAAHIAFAEHYPLTLSPDDVWLCLAQGFALHVEANAEALRSRFVRHNGQITLTIERDNFVMGSPHNDWQGCFAEWSDAIAAHIGKKRDLVVADFSTTGPIERAASEVVLMSAMKNYFNYRLLTRCGIPAITLLGTVSDWQAIRRRAEVFAEFDLTGWVRALLPVLDQFVKAASGAIDRTFWESIYKLHGGSGGPYVTGWINVLFPYLDGGFPDGGIVQNDAAFMCSNDASDEGPTIGSFPCGLSRVPLAWDYLGTVLPMALLAGFVGISQDRQTRAVRPAIGWAVHPDARSAQPA